MTKAKKKNPAREAQGSGSGDHASGVQSSKVSITALSAITLTPPDPETLERGGWSYDVRRDMKDDKQRPTDGVYTLARRVVSRKIGAKSVPTKKRRDTSSQHFRRSTDGGQTPPWVPVGDCDPMTPQGSAEADEPSASEAVWEASEASGQSTCAGGVDGDVVSRADSVEFAHLPSMVAMGTGKASVVVGFDTEFFYVDRPDTGEPMRVVLSYQMVVVDPTDPSRVVEMVALPHTGVPLRLTALSGDLIEVAGLYRGRKGWQPNGVSRKYKDPFNYAIPMTLISHYGQADISAFRPEDLTRERQSPQQQDIMRRLVRAGGGLVSVGRVRVPARGASRRRWLRPVSLVVRDTCALAPAGASLASLGDVVGVPKIDTGDHYKAHMDEYRDAELNQFLAYGCQDAHICLEYAAAQWGDGVEPPLSISTASAHAIREHIVVSQWGDLSDGGYDKFRARFQGLIKSEGGGYVTDDSGGTLTYIREAGYAPRDADAAQLLNAATEAYFGGLNAADRIGICRSTTYDVDMKNAYPTAQALVRDPDYRHPKGCIESIERDVDLSIEEHVPALNSPCFAYVTDFEFPNTVAWPSIPTRVEGIPVYTSSGDDTSGRWVPAPELWVALNLGARIHAQVFITYRVVTNDDGQPAYWLRHAVASLIADRETCKRTFGKNSIEQQTLKLAVNGGYGKSAQAVAGGRTWSPLPQEMQNLAPSAITSPVHAAMTTSIVRAVLLAVMNQLITRGYKVWSVTTDGFITDAPLEVVDDCDLYGAIDTIREARQELTGDSAVWEVKHDQDAFYNITTRGNIGLEDGVLARAGVKTPRGVTNDREYHLELAVTRTGRVDSTYWKLTGFRDLSLVKDRRDFVSTKVEVQRRLDYDMKREPVSDDMGSEVVEIDGTEYEVATVCTRPWRTVDAYQRGRSLLKDLPDDTALRTVDEWQTFLMRLRYSHSGRHIISWQRSVILSLLIHLRAGAITIPVLEDMSVADKCTALSHIGLGIVTKSDWKNARRPERVSAALPVTDPTLRSVMEHVCSPQWDGRTPWEFASHPVTSTQEVAA